MLTIGYIGNGKSTNRYHLPFVIQRNHIKVKTIYQRNPENESWNRIPNVNYISDLDTLLNDETIDLIVVCTKMNSHYEYAKMVLQHHKHCLVEKPFTETSEQAKELFDLARENGLIVQPYQNRRFDSDFLTVQKVIESGVLGDLHEIEMHYDYFRPEVPESSTELTVDDAYLYAHGTHTVDQVISYFGKPDDIHYDIRQLLGKNRMNDYFDLDFYYNSLKISVKSSYFRIKERPSFAVYGKKGCFIKQTKDRQEEHLKLFYMPHHKDFGLDTLEHFGVLTYVDQSNVYQEEKVPTVPGDYGRIYDDLYEAIVNGEEKAIKDEETIWQLEILETGLKTIQ
ncbi:MAG TPA: Gfo/Idh/MocA family oxidoreductase [Pseudogracilibacillus sp.]|nr:Gfo/Idh/MocA family oxidoreductase [Pseudogracilibacillus sp.]